MSQEIYGGQSREGKKRAIDTEDEDEEAEFIEQEDLLYRVRDAGLQARNAAERLFPMAEFPGLPPGPEQVFGFIERLVPPPGFVDPNATEVQQQDIPQPTPRAQQHDEPQHQQISHPYLLPNQSIQPSPLTAQSRHDAFADRVKCPLGMPYNVRGIRINNTFSYCFSDASEAEKKDSTRCSVRRDVDLCNECQKISIPDMKLVCNKLREPRREVVFRRCREFYGDAAWDANDLV